MIIKKIYMENLFSHKRTEISFDRGLTAIVGPNGAGKSSIIEAIFLALFDSGPQMSHEILRTGRSKRGIVRIGANGALIILEFEVGGKLYRVRREYDADGGSLVHILSEVTGDGERVLARGVSDVTKYISKILGAEDPRIFTSTIFSRQDMLSQILEMPPSERKSKILSLLGLKELEEARDLARETANKAERILGELSSYETNLKKLREALAKDREERQRLASVLEAEAKRVSELEAKRGEIASRLGVLERILEISREIEALEKAERDVKDLENEIKEVDARLGLLKSAGLDLEAIRKINTAYRSSYECIKREEQLRKKIKFYEESIDRIKLEIYSESVRRDLETLGIDPGLGPDEILAKLEGLIDVMARRLGEIRGLLDMYRKLYEIKPEGNRCPFCGRELDLDTLSHISEKHKLEISRLEDEEKRIRSGIEKAKAARSRIEAGLRELKNHLEKREESLKELEEVEKCANNGREICVSLANKLRGIGYQGSLGNECQELLEGIEGELRRLIERRGVLEKRLRDARSLYDPSKLDSLRREVESIIKSNQWLGEGASYTALKASLEKERDKIQGEIEALRTRIGVIRGNIEMLEKSIREREQEIASIEEKIRKKPSIENALKILRILEKKILGGEGLIAQMLTQMVIKALEEEVNRSLETFSREFTVEIESDFNINIKAGSRGTLSINSLSGGERTMLAIAFRIALAKILLGRLPSIMILDEPTQNLDVENKSRLFDMIKEIAGSLDQVIVVTHDEEIIEKADKIIRVAIEDGVSRVYT
ncbi:MAG TPA: SMC family ATPase [Sulfolobales archaeon]|nr:SMC family ATPase [Sulfolobales archaeon]